MPSGSWGRGRYRVIAIHAFRIQCIQFRLFVGYLLSFRDNLLLLVTSRRNTALEH